MFGNKEIVALLLDSEKITLVASQKINGEQKLSGFLTKDYSGYQDGKFVDNEELFAAVKSLVDSLSYRFCIKAKKIIVGVPGDFTCTNVKSIAQSTSGIIKRKDIDKLWKKDTNFVGSADFSLLKKKCLYYNADGSEAKIYDPVGVEANSIIAKVSYLLCERGFTELFDSIAARLGVRFDYVSLILSEAEYLSSVYSLEKSKEYAIINAGSGETTVAICNGDSTVDMRTFALGTANIAGALAVGIDVPMSHAKKIAEKINLNLSAGNDEKYTVFENGENSFYSISDANTCASEVVKEIAVYSKRAFADMKKNPATMDVYFTGSRLCSQHGVREIVSFVVGKNVEIAHPSLMCFKSTEYYQLVALLAAYTGKLRNIKG